MAQTTGAMSWVDSYLEYSQDGSSWIDFSGFSNALSVSGGDRAIGEVFTSDGDTPIITAGKRSMLEVAVTAVYTEGSSDVWPDAFINYDTDDGGAFYFRWAPAGSDSGNAQYTTSAGELINPGWPMGESDNPDALTVEIVLACASISKGVI